MHTVKKYGKQYYLYILLIAGAAAVVAITAFRWQESRTVMAQTGQSACIVLDAGHGGEDGGTSSATGVLESGLNLEIVLRLEQLFALFGQETVMTRDGDYAIYDSGCQTLSEKKVSDLKNRVALVNETPGAILLSIHQNYYGQSQYSGAQIFYGAEGNSQAIAEALQAQFATALQSGQNRTAKAVENNVYLMNHVNCTAVLIECGFLSNLAESQKLQDSGYQKQMSAVIACTVLQQLAQEGKEPSEV